MMQGQRVPVMCQCKSGPLCEVEQQGAPELRVGSLHVGRQTGVAEA